MHSSQHILNFVQCVYLQLWYLRLSSLSRLRLFNQTSAELTNLYTILTSPSLPPATSAYLFDKLVPFELEVLKAKVKYWSGDQMGYLDELTRLVRRCKVMSRKACTGLHVKESMPAGQVATTTTTIVTGQAKVKKSKGRDEIAIDMWKERGTRVCLILASQLIEMKVPTSNPPTACELLILISVRTIRMANNRTTEQQHPS